MSSIIYNGHEIQDLIVNGNQAQLWLNGQKLYPTEEPGPVDTGYYFDFGNTYTLNSGTQGSVDLSNTNLKNATKAYVCIAMDIFISSLLVGAPLDELSIGGFNDYAQIDVYNRLVISSLITSKNLVLETNSTRSYPIVYSSEVNNVVRICFIFHSAGANFRVNVGIRTSSSTSWKYDIPVYTGSFSAKDFTTISTPGNGSGAIEATKFVGRGFDVLQDAKKWFNSLT